MSINKVLCLSILLLSSIFCVDVLASERPVRQPLSELVSKKVEERKEEKKLQHDQKEADDSEKEVLPLTSEERRSKDLKAAARGAAEGALAGGATWVVGAIALEVASHYVEDLTVAAVCPSLGPVVLVGSIAGSLYRYGTSK